VVTPGSSHQPNIGSPHGAAAAMPERLGVSRGGAGGFGHPSRTVLFSPGNGTSSRSRGKSHLTSHSAARHREPKCTNCLHCKHIKEAGLEVGTMLILHYEIYHHERSVDPFPYLVAREQL
jgi:hypothetical protein